ncbi:MAG: hypothetical protein ABIF18_02255 [archaeon]
MVNKKGDYKYGIILSLILGVMVLSLSLYFIFQELWSSDELDWEICRQSIQIRALLPDVEKAGITAISFKDDYPLKCKTMIIEVNKKNVEDIDKIIGDTMARCWALFDKGRSNSFPAQFYKSSICVPCARIHLTEDAKKYMEANEKKYKYEGGVIGTNIRNALDLPMTKKYSYYGYLNNSGKKFSAFIFGNGFPFDLEGGEFKIEATSFPWEYAYLTNELSGGNFTAKMTTKDISLPKIFDITKGDLLINYGIVTMSDENFGNYIPYLFYFQANQEPDPFKEVKEKFIFNRANVLASALEFSFSLQSDEANILKESSVGFCEQWEGIPA